MKYRLVKRARGWVVQEMETDNTLATLYGRWLDRACWKWRWAGLLHLLWLRERARK